MVDYRPVSWIHTRCSSPNEEKENKYIQNGDNHIEGGGISDTEQHDNCAQNHDHCCSWTENRKSNVDIIQPVWRVQPPQCPEMSKVVSPGPSNDSRANGVLQCQVPSDPV